MKLQKQTVLYFIIILVAISGFSFTVLLDQPYGFYAFLITLALGGLSVSANVWITKAKKLQLVCPTGSDCNAVVNSSFSRFLGIKLEYMGVLYFLVIISIYLAFIFNPELLQRDDMITAVVLLTVGAAGFSCYLLFIQAFLLRKWCIWCILASILSLSVFFISLVSLPNWVELMSEWVGFLEFVQFLGYALGLGGVTSGVFLFFKRFLNDREVDDDELDTLKSFSELVWVGFGLVLLMQLAFMVVNPDLLSSGRFLAGVIALLLSGLAGAIIIVILSPYIVFIPFGENKRSTWLSKLRQPLFVFGAIGVSSWYFTFTTHFLPEYDLSIMLVALVVVLALAITISLLWEKFISSTTGSVTEG